MPQTVCTLCNGQAIVTYRYGKPGQDRHKPNSEIEWDGPGKDKICPACEGKGERYQRPSNWPATIVYLKHGGDIDYEKTANERHEREGTGWTTKQKQQTSPEALAWPLTSSPTPPST